MRNLREIVHQLARKDGRYAAEAYEFLFESLEAAVRLAGRADATGPDRHITGQELILGLREESRRLFGPLGAEVWRNWGIEEALDWGRIVFLLVEEKLLNRRESDTIDDFRQGFDFDRYFVEEYVFDLPEEIGPGG
jgi:uncharacterized repeat protein (TIGR04138 family)